MKFLIRKFSSINAFKKKTLLIEIEMTAIVFLLSMLNETKLNEKHNYEPPRLQKENKLEKTKHSKVYHQF